MSIPLYVVAILGLALLIVVHEAGHYFAARWFGMRVIKFSIGFGPTIWKYKPKNSPTTYQVAIIPFLAYVQIAGMNPYEENDPKDPGSYMNASLWGRAVTMAAGPLTNYFFASILIFLGLMLGGDRISERESMRVMVDPDGAAAQGDIRDGDKILSVNGVAVANWDELAAAIGKHPGEAIDVEVDRSGVQSHKSVTPAAKGAKYEGKILIGPFQRVVPVGIGEAAKRSVIEPPMVVYGTIRGISRWISGKEKAEMSGPPGIVKEIARAAREGPGVFFDLLGALSAYLGAFNLLPFPALDGGRLMFLGVEALSRRKPDAKLEARIHAVGLLMLLGLIAVVSWFDIAKR